MPLFYYAYLVVSRSEMETPVTQFTRKYVRYKLLRVYKRIRSVQYNALFIISLRFQEIRLKLSVPILRISRFSIRRFNSSYRRW